MDVPEEPVDAWPHDWIRVFPAQIVPEHFGRGWYESIEFSLAHVRRRLSGDRRIINTAIGFSEAAQGTAKARKTGVTPDRYAACVDPQFFYQLIFIYERLFALPEVMPDIGEPPVVAPSKMALIRPGASPAHGLRLPRVLVNGEERVPDYKLDAARYDVLQTLVKVSHSFLLLHELGHIASGHCDYQKLVYGAAEVSEDPDPPLEIDIGELRAMEVQADILATYANLFMVVAEDIAHLTSPREQQTFCRFMGFGAGIIFCLFDAYAQASAVDSRYPPPLLRAFAAQTFGEAGNLGAFGSAHRDGVYEAFNAWNAAGWGPLQSPTKQDAESLQRDLPALVDRLNRLGIGVGSP